MSSNRLQIFVETRLCALRETVLALLVVFTFISVGPDIADATTLDLEFTALNNSGLHVTSEGEISTSSIPVSMEITNFDYGLDSVLGYLRLTSVRGELDPSVTGFIAPQTTLGGVFELVNQQDEVLFRGDLVQSELTQSGNTLSWYSAGIQSVSGLFIADRQITSASLSLEFVTDIESLFREITERIQVGTEQVQVGVERIQTGTERVQVGVERIQVGTERRQTGVERIQTGFERVLIGFENGRPIFEDRPVFSERPIYSDVPVYDERPVFEERPVYADRPIFEQRPVYVEVVTQLPNGFAFNSSLVGGSLRLDSQEPIPEPTTAALFASGMLLAARKRKSRRNTISSF